MPDPAEVFRRMVQVIPRRETGLIDISLSGPNPDEITKWVNVIAEVYVKRNFEKAQENMREALSVIGDQLDTFKHSLGLAEAARVQKLEDQDILDPESQEAITRAQLKTYHDELTEVQIEMHGLGQTLRQIRVLQNSRGDLMSLPELADDETLKELHRTKIGLEQELETAKVEFRPGHPEYEGTVGRLAKLEQRIQERTGRILDTLTTQYDLDGRREAYLLAQITHAERLSLDMVKATSNYDMVRQDAEAQRRILDVIGKAMNEVQIGMQLMTNNVSVLDAAMIPRRPIKPRERLNLMVGAMFGLFLGLAAAFFLDYLDNTFRTPEDIEKYLGLSVLGVIPKIGEEGLGNRAVKEAYQSLRTSMIFSSKNRERKVMLVTSSGPQEGKSATVANLGRILAQAGERVIIVDADLRRPTQHVIHGAERDHGLTNYLAAPTAETDWSIYTKQTEASPTLRVMTCGPIPPSPPELLGSERFSAMLQDMRRHYEWIIIDSPPASSLTDSTLLADAADMVVMVIQHNKTDRDLVRKSLQRIGAVDTAVAGAVLNNVDIDRAYSKDYYYASYYYYGESVQEPKGKSKKRRVESKASVG